MKVSTSTLALVIGAGFLFAASLAQAATGNTVSITATGSVAKACTVALDSGNSTETKSLGDLTQSGSGVSIGSVTETCNDAGGYTVTLASANDGNLKGATTGATLAYTLTYGGGSVNLSSGSATVTTATAVTDGALAAKPVLISWTGSPNLTADTYSDTLTITMAAP